MKQKQNGLGQNLRFLCDQLISLVHIDHEKHKEWKIYVFTVDNLNVSRVFSI